MSNRLNKEARKGFRGNPIATIAYYVPDNRKATKVVVGIVIHDYAEPDFMKNWHSGGDIRFDNDIEKEIFKFTESHEVRFYAMTFNILGCPHEEGIDYPEGEICPQCPYWAGKNRFAGLLDDASGN